MRTNPSAFSLALLAALAVLLLPLTIAADEPSSGAAQPEKAALAGPPDVLLVTVDTLRPDALGWVAGTNATPVVDGLAARGVAMAGAISPVPITLPAHASVMTGWVPLRHGVRDNGQPLGDGPATLAEHLAAGGWATGAFVSGYPLAEGFGLSRGFGTYEGPSDDEPRDSEAAVPDAGLERRASATAAAAVRWLENHPQRSLLWVHFYDPHDPYDPPEDLRPAASSDGDKDGLAEARALYDAEVRAVDRALGDVLAAYEDRGRQLLTVFTADHGESLGEHGEATHGFFIYDATVKVPLIFSWPGRLEPARSAAPARLVDVAPTVLDLLELAPLENTDGVSLLPLLENPAAEDALDIPAALVESQRPWFSYGWAPLTALRQGRNNEDEAQWKLIRAPQPELYDLAADPGETTNLVNQRRPVARRLADALRQRETEAPAGDASNEGAEVVDAETLAKLRSLGYAGAGTRPPRGPSPDELAKLADPKDRIELWNLLGEAEAKMQAGDLQAAIALYNRVLGQEPRNPYALARSGWAMALAGDTRSSVSRLRRAVEGAPWQPEMREYYAQTLTAAGQLDAAVEQWQELVKLQPQRSKAWSRLGTAFGLAGQPEKAAEALAQAQELAPKDDELAVRHAFAEHGAGRPEKAAELLLEVAERAPDAFVHGASLGTLLSQLDRDDDARQWLQASEPGHPGYPQGRLELARLELAAGNTEAAKSALADAVAADPSAAAAAQRDPQLAPLLNDG